MSSELQRTTLTLRGVHSPGPPSVFAVVVDEHVVTHCQHVPVHVGGTAQHHLESTHVSRVARVLQTVLVAFEKELQKISANNNNMFTTKIFKLRHQTHIS